MAKKHKIIRGRSKNISQDNGPINLKKRRTVLNDNGGNDSDDARDEASDITFTIQTINSNTERSTTQASSTSNINSPHGTQHEPVTDQTKTEEIGVIRTAMLNDFNETEKELEQKTIDELFSMIVQFTDTNSDTTTVLEQVTKILLLAAQLSGKSAHQVLWCENLKQKEQNYDYATDGKPTLHHPKIGGKFPALGPSVCNPLKNYFTMKGQTERSYKNALKHLLAARKLNFFLRLIHRDKSHEEVKSIVNQHMLAVRSLQALEQSIPGIVDMHHTSAQARRKRDDENRTILNTSLQTSTPNDSSTSIASSPILQREKHNSSNDKLERAEYEPITTVRDSISEPESEGNEDVLEEDNAAAFENIEERHATELLDKANDEETKITQEANATTIETHSTLLEENLPIEEACFINENVSELDDDDMSDGYDFNTTETNNPEDSYEAFLDPNNSSRTQQNETITNIPETQTIFNRAQVSVPKGNLQTFPELASHAHHNNETTDELAAVIIEHKKESNADPTNQNSRIQILKTLLTADNINYRTPSDGTTPAMIFAYAGDVEGIKLCIELGADTNIRDADGNTPLHWVAKSRDNTDIASILIESNAKLMDYKNNNGQYAYHLARENKFHVLENFICDQDFGEQFTITAKCANEKRENTTFLIRPEESLRYVDMCLRQILAKSTTASALPETIRYTVNGKEVFLKNDQGDCDMIDIGINKTNSILHYFILRARPSFSQLSL